MIERFRFGHFVIDGRCYDNDIKIINDEVTRWRCIEHHKFTFMDLKELFDANPEVIIIGIGTSKACRVESAIKEEAEKRGVRLVIAETSEACREYNDVRKRSDKVAAIMHSTC